MLAFGTSLYSHWELKNETNDNNWTEYNIEKKQKKKRHEKFGCKQR